MKAKTNKLTGVALMAALAGGSMAIVAAPANAKPTTLPSTLPQLPEDPPPPPPDTGGSEGGNENLLRKAIKIGKFIVKYAPKVKSYFKGEVSMEAPTVTLMSNTITLQDGKVTENPANSAQIRVTGDCGWFRKVSFLNQKKRARELQRVVFYVDNREVERLEPGAPQHFDIKANVSLLSDAEAADAAGRGHASITKSVRAEIYCSHDKYWAKGDYKRERAESEVTFEID